MRILAIDPGVHQLGIAWGTKGGGLEGATLWRPRRGTIVLAEMQRWAIECCEEKPTHLVIERPVIRKNAGVRQSDILDLTLVVGAISAHTATAVTYKQPSEWGAVGKKRTERRIRKRLSPSELSNIMLHNLKKVDHNIWDAVGIFLWAAGRYKP